MIQIRNLSKQFKGQVALKNINLTIQTGSIFGVIGMSGSGKSTLIRCLNGLEKPDSGEIYLADQKILGVEQKELRHARSKIGMIFQHFNLFNSRTAEGNVTYPLEISGLKQEEQRHRAFELLELVGLKGKENFYPANLSGGEKQRVAIARALANQPAILLCDEATSALDPRTTHSILELLSHLNEKFSLTILLITHEMEAVKQICTHVAVLESGEIVEEGTTSQLFASAQHPTTKRFLQSLTHTIPSHLLPRREGEEILHLCFKGKSAAEPIISRLIRRYQVEINILFGGIDLLRQEAIGNLVVVMTGSELEREQARQFLEKSGVTWEWL